MANEAFQRLKSILVSGSLTLITKKRILECYVLPILLYGSECWTISSQMTKKLEAVELWFYRRILKVSWTSHQINEEILKRMNTTGTLRKTIRQRQIRFFGHLIRKDGMESLSIMGKIDGKRSRRRQRTTYMYVKGMTSWTGTTPCELIHAARDRNRWRIMTADVRQDMAH